MPLDLVGTLPVSAVNVGLAASIGGLNLEIAKLTADVSDLGVALAAQVDIATDFPPAVTAYATPLAAQFSLPEIAAQFNPLNMVSASADLSVDLAAKIGTVTAQIAVLDALAATLSAGLDAGGIGGWTYAGRAPGLGIELEQATARGVAGFAPDDEVTGVVIATENFASWGALAEGVNVGRTAAAPAATGSQRLTFLGSLSGGQWNTGVAELMLRFRNLLGELNGIKLGLEASADVAIGLNLPDIQTQVDVGAAILADIGVAGLLDNLVNVQADVSGSIGLVNAKIDVIAGIVADITAQISAGGLTFWSYSGSVRALGSALRPATQQGLPSGSGPAATAYGLVLIGAPPSMTTLGAVLKTAA
jgi:hypothetical protein